MALISVFRVFNEFSHVSCTCMCTCIYCKIHIYATNGFTKFIESAQAKHLTFRLYHLVKIWFRFIFLELRSCFFSLFKWKMQSSACPICTAATVVKSKYQIHWKRVFEQQSLRIYHKQCSAITSTFQHWCVAKFSSIKISDIIYKTIFHQLKIDEN